MSTLKKIELNILESLDLVDELTGTKAGSDSSFTRKGIFSQKLSMSDKFDLKILFDKLASLIKTYNEVRSDYIKENGVEKEDGSFEIKPTITTEEGEVENPDFVAFKKMHEKLLTDKHSIDLKVLSPERFDFQSEEVYPAFMNLLEKMAEPVKK